MLSKLWTYPNQDANIPSIAQSLYENMMWHSFIECYKVCSCMMVNKWGYQWCSENSLTSFRVKKYLFGIWEDTFLKKIRRATQNVQIRFQVQTSSVEKFCTIKRVKHAQPCVLHIPGICTKRRSKSIPSPVNSFVAVQKRASPTQNTSASS